MDKLLLIDDEADVQYSFRRIFDSAAIELHTASSGEEGLKLVPKLKPDLVLMDIRMGTGMNGLETLRRLRQHDARLPVIMMTAYGTTQTAIEAMKLGAYDYLLKPFDVPKLKQLVADALQAARAMRQTVSCQPLLESEDYDLGIVGRSAPMQEVFKLVGQTAGTDATVLITGESGTGKELVARAIYTHSRRAEQPFLAINCAAIPENLLESELFGHEKGAFTGAATQRIGKFEQCNGGTIFLDEIGDMSLPTQTKILRVLQNGSFERVGGNQPVNVDVRVIAATNKPLEEAVAARSFREDLFYRLNVIRIQLPPLRRRREDIRLLVDYFLRKYARARSRPPGAIHPDALAALERHHWPGNVRELENVIQRSLVVGKADAIMLADLPAEILTERPSVTAEPAPAAAPARVPEPGAANEVPALARALFAWARAQRTLKVLPAVERELVICALAETHGNQVQAAKLLGITRATLRKRIEKFGIQRELSIH
ncbi:MAG: two-component system NtrC family nitrogen regulation response regulator GlnG [Limisphaerales bacterium]|nr:MAG: two-component system NtrC family nitrogen regulation response regulator GlnG [Limisphaerales bacterium]KAG0507462.1 MAG: two-component system NtrC family nitrogen regulation response regulator GlnG [Limisphaerales bacterium]TXT47945.1 MAG: two-component system NtrC family nitrogen regulation response regulator GlnG [Limisphaerales bacterium]